MTRQPKAQSTRYLLIFGLLLALGLACSDRAIGGEEGCDGMCQPYGPEQPGVGECLQGACSPTFFDCISKEEISTCAEACAAQGSTCVENACAEATYLLYGSMNICEHAPGMGGPFERGCDEAIDWQVFNGAVQCCCEQI